MLNILIVDDESLARQRLRNLILAVEVDCNIREAANGVAALQMVNEEAPDILFLDIQMPELSGFDVLKQLNDPKFPIIFQTAFEEFAIKAFEVSACDYLLKPFDRERLALALQRAKVRIDVEAKLKDLNKYCLDQQIFLNAISIRTAREHRVKQVVDICAFVSKDHCTTVMEEGREFTCDLSLDKLEEQLDGALFCRIHRNALVNLKKVKAVLNDDGGMVELVTGERVEVSRRRLPELKKVLGLS